MAHYDLATVHLYETNEFLEVVFPYDADFSNFLKSLKGRWVPARKCWQISFAASGKSPADLVTEIENKIYDLAPPGWRDRVASLRTLTCVMKGYEITAGAGGLRLELPPGHPSHYAMKKAEGATEVGGKWLIPSRFAGGNEVKEVIQRMLREDQKKFFEQMEAGEERGVIGPLLIAEAEAEAYGIVDGGLVATTPGFVAKADPGMASTPIRNFCFEIMKATRSSEAEYNVRMFYPPAEQAYKFLQGRAASQGRKAELDAAHAGEGWIQKRM